MSGWGRIAPCALLALALQLGCTPTVYDKDGKPITLGRFRLRTYPKGAKVWINGELKVERTPATLVLPAGTYQLEIQAPAAESMHHEITIEAGRSKELNLRIPPSPPSTLRVFSDVVDAEVRVNGYRRGTTPLLGAPTTPGPVDLTVTAGNTAKSVRVRLGVGESKTVEVFFGDVECAQSANKPDDAPLQSLPRSQGLLTLGVNPKATVSTDEGQLLGIAPLVEQPLEPGEHDLVLRSLDGRYERHVTIEVNAEQPAVYRFQLGADDEVLGWRPDAGAP